MKTKRTSAENIPLIPISELGANVKTILLTSKTQSDRDIARLHDANVKRRAAKKKQ